ncbi:GTP-binding protein [Francisella philomiragia]|uniref:CobW family GTP-binding protein n=1 Tax=Francisella philomiragia TaxID=28110 RepID=UPI003516302D
MQDMAPQKLIPVIVITGFLGSRKTTFLSKLLRQEGMSRTAIIINEFGEVGLDHALVEHSDEDIVELQNGCICCTIRADLTQTLLNLANKLSNKDTKEFDRVVIETTGLADPAPIIHTLMRSFELHQNYKLAGVITIVDAVNGASTLDIHQEALKQAAMTERIVTSKTGIADKKIQENLISVLKSINLSTQIIDGVDKDAVISAITGLNTYDSDSKSEEILKWLAIEEFDQHHNHDYHNINLHS